MIARPLPCLAVLLVTLLFATPSAHGQSPNTTRAEQPPAAPDQDSTSDTWKAAREAEAKRAAAALKAAPALEFPLAHNMADPGKDTYAKQNEWKATDFIGKGTVRVDGDVVYLERGNDLTGITWAGPLVRMNYEITLDAMRFAGKDFFCALTFPVGDDPCTLIVGGWGGALVGLSCLDYDDAANNETTCMHEFKFRHWYRIRLRVTQGSIEAWIDEEKLIDVKTEGRAIGIRHEVERSKPLGIATWRTTGAIRNIRLQALKASPAQPAASK